LNLARLSEYVTAADVPSTATGSNLLRGTASLARCGCQPVKTCEQPAAGGGAGWGAKSLPGVAASAR